ncbi:NAD-dependent epimerase/dehydratase [Lasiodiplodia theobromae]|nr:NAD-dependent epimerase/dehydratase [Lasiodiplodia theobromae]
MAGKSVLIIGPGFIGWPVLDLLVAEGYHVTGLVRRDEHANAIRKSRARAVLGDLHNADLIAQETTNADIVIHTATADDLPSATAVLTGIRRRAAIGRRTIYIHTSGTGVLDDGAAGAFSSSTIYADDDPAAIDALPDTAPHRAIDLAVTQAAKELGEKAKIAILLPPVVYGYVEEHDRLSIQIPTLARFALVNGWAGHVGKGLGVESCVHVRDLARGYVVLLHALEKQSAEWVLGNPYFFCENGAEGEFEWREAARRVAEGLHKAGKLYKADVGEFRREDYKQLFGEVTEKVLGHNSRSRARRLRELGWEAREKGVWESWEEDELPALLREWDARKGEKRSAYEKLAA